MASVRGLQLPAVTFRLSHCDQIKLNWGTSSADLVKWARAFNEGEWKTTANRDETSVLFYFAGGNCKIREQLEYKEFQVGDTNRMKEQRKNFLSKMSHSEGSMSRMRV